jgi:hypothetical protein
VEEVYSPSPTTPLSLQQQRENNNNIINFHIVLKMKSDYKELVLELLFVHRRRFTLRSFLDTFK